MRPAPSVATGHGVDGSHAWLRLGISLLLGTIGGVGIWAVVVVLPAVQADFGVDRGGASLPYTANMIGFAAGNVLVGRYVDRLGVAIPVAVAASALGLGFILTAATTSIWQFTLIQALVGFGSSVFFGPMMADISHWFERHRGIAITAIASGNYTAGAIWPIVIGALQPLGGWRVSFVIIGIFCMAAMVPLSFLLRARAPHTASAAGDAAAHAGKPAKHINLSPAALQALLIVAGLGCCMAMSMPQVHIVAYCTDLGYGAARGSEMLSLMLGAGILSRLGSGLLADRIGGVRTLLLGSVLQGISLFLYIPFDGLASLYVVSFVFGLSQGGIVPCYAIIVREYLPAREAGQRVGIVIMATIVGMALGGWVSGWIYDMTGSYHAAFLNGIAWNLLNVATMVFVLMRTGNTPRPAAASA